MLSNSREYRSTEEIGSTKVGTCTAHAYKCGRTCGIFLRITECQILLLHLNINGNDDIQVRGCLKPAPYIDDYGETDQGLMYVFIINIFIKHWNHLYSNLRRGNPLHLCKNRYDKLHKMWLIHAVPDEVSRSYQNNQSSMQSFDWILF